MFAINDDSLYESNSPENISSFPSVNRSSRWMELLLLFDGYVSWQTKTGKDDKEERKKREDDEGEEKAEEEEEEE